MGFKHTFVAVMPDFFSSHLAKKGGFRHTFVAVMLLTAVAVLPSLAGATSSCGNGTCDSGENACNCAADCGKCEGEVPDRPCRAFGCVDNFCRITIVMNCCPNDICEGGESYGNCPNDCIPKVVSGEILKPEAGEEFMRGEDVLIKVRVTADGRSVASTDINATGFFGVIKPFYNDGRHNDDLLSDNVYAAKLRIAKDAPEGSNPVNVDLNFLGVKGRATFNLVVNPKLSTTLNTASAYALGDIIDLSGTVSKKGEPISLPLDINVAYEGTLVHSRRTQSDENTGGFSATYHSTMIDPAGEWKITVSGADAQGNYVLLEKTTGVNVPRAVLPLSIEQLITPKPKYSRGEELQLAMRVRDEAGASVNGAGVVVVAPNGEKISLQELQPGQYTAVHPVAYDTPLGFQEFKTVAISASESIQYRGSSSMGFFVEPAKLQIAVLSPDKRHFRLGETALFEIEVSYPNGEFVPDANLQGLVGGSVLSFLPVARGVFESTYTFQKGDEGSAKIYIEAKDRYGNSGLETRQIEISGETVWFVFQENAQYIAAAAIAVVIVGSSLGYAYAKRTRRKRLIKRRAYLTALEAELQKGYYEEGTVSKKEFKGRMEKYEKELARVDSLLEEMKEKQGGKKR